MSIDFEERLRAEMGRVQVRPRPGLAREAHRRYARSRRRTALAVAATGTAAAVAGATAGFALTAGTPGPGPIETTAYVLNHVSRALAATDAIGYTTAHYSGTDATGFFSNPVVTWEFGGLSRQLIESSAGQPLVDNSARPEHGRGAIISVHYPSRDWMSITVPSSELPRPPARNNGCEDNFLSAFAAGENTAADWKQIMQDGLTCGMFTIAGRQWVDGVDAIKLTGHTPAAGTTIWVDPSSYLPVRLTGRVQLVAGDAGKQDAATLTIDFRWLPPTSANLKELTAPIPHGFRKVSG
jgi:hypothetical protein